MAGDSSQDRFLGAILGLAIGDAFGMPVQGLSPATIVDVYGDVTDYLPRTFTNGDAVSPGEITDETEFALCIIESVTAGQGEVDVENIGIRMAYLARGDSRRWMSPEVVAALEGPSEQSDFRLPLRDDEPVGPDILARGVPVGLLHSMGPGAHDGLRSDAEAVTRITHGSPLAISLVEATARATRYAARGDLPLARLRSVVGAEVDQGEVKAALASDGHGPVTGWSANVAVQTLCEALDLAAAADSFEALLTEAVRPGGASDSRAAIAASLYGAHHGSEVIPQRQIDQLEARIYVSLAVPWYYRTVARKAGRVIDFRNAG